MSQDKKWTAFFPAIPVRVKSKVVDAFEIHERWKEEVDLLKTEIANFLKFYTEVRIPEIKKAIASLEEKMISHGIYSNTSNIGQ